MRLARRTFLASTMASVAAPAVLRVAWAAAPQYSLKLHHSLSSVSSGHDKFLAPWARKVQADSGGRIRIDIFPSMQLGGAPAQLYDQARDGLADIVWAMPCNTPGRFPKIELFELPFVPSSRSLVSSKAIEDFAGIALKDEFHEVHALSFSCTDRGIIHANRPVQTIEQIKGLRLHVQTRFAAEAMQTLGARAVPMPMSQIPMAISQHVVDGCVDPWDAVPALKIHDLLKAHTDFTDSSLSTTTFVLAMNKGAYERLPPDLKNIIDANSGQAAADMAGAMWDVQAAAVADMVSKRGDPITTLMPEAVAHWRKATNPVVEDWLKQMKGHKADGDKLLSDAYALIEKYMLEPEPASMRPQPAQPQQAQQQATQPPSQSVAVEPPAAGASANPNAGIPSAAPAHSVANPDVGNPVDANPIVAKPVVTNPVVANPEVAKPALAKPAAVSAPAATHAPATAAAASAPAPAAPVVKPAPPLARVVKPAPAVTLPPKTLDIPL
jgi:TRAP-type C4-dicarboxylate transport system substrate-binding protein